MPDDTDPAVSRSKLFDLSIDLLCIADTEGRFRLVNPAFERTLGWTREQLLSRPFYEFVHPDDLAATEREVEKLASGIPTISFENRYRCADGSYKLLRWNTRPDPATGLLYAVASDVTEERRMEEELRRAKEAAEEAVRARTAFLTSVSHEIRTPMNGIVGMTELALQRAIDPTVRRQLEVVRESADHLLELIEDLLDLSQIEAGRLELVDAPFRLRATVDSSVRALAWAAHAKDLELAYFVAPEVPPLLTGDAGRLRQILVNLIGNAIKFTDRGAVTVEVDREEGSGAAVRVGFRVRDTGIGIAPEDQARIFEAFTQLPGPEGRRRGGSGLGLSITQQLVRLMGGSLAVSSAVGSGTTFRASIPFGALPLAAGEVEPLGRLLQGRAVVVGARPTTREFLVRTLRGMGLEVEVRGSLEEASELLAAPAEERLVACVVDTVGLEDGVLAALEPVLSVQPELRVVAVVGAAAERERLQRLRATGVSAALVQPVSETELRDAIEEPAPERRIRAAERSLRVLVAEDGEVNREVLRGLLESHGHRVDLVWSGQAAVDAAALREHDVALLDVELPGLDGVEAARRIRSAESGSGARLPLVAVTGRATTAQRHECFEAGMDEFLAKPITDARLQAALSRAMSGAALQRSFATRRERRASSIDWRAALRSSGGQTTVLRRLVGAARQELPRLAAACREAAAARQGESLRRAAHTLASTLGYFGATELRRMARELEEAGGAGRFERAEELLARMAEPLDAVRRELDEIPEGADLAARGGNTP